MAYLHPVGLRDVCVTLHLRGDRILPGRRGGEGEGEGGGEGGGGGGAGGREEGRGGRGKGEIRILQTQRAKSYEGELYR